MKFGIYVEMQNPEQNKKPHELVYQEVLEQIEHADKRGFSTFNTLEHHWFEEFSISTNPMALYAVAAQRTKDIRFRTCSHVLPLHSPYVWVGSPDEIKERVARVVEACPDLTEIALLCAYAGMEHWKTIRTQELFSQHIMPAFQEQKEKTILR